MNQLFLRENTMYVIRVVEDLWLAIAMGIAKFIDTT
jgi:hypothetical protein